MGGIYSLRIGSKFIHDFLQSFKAECYSSDTLNMPMIDEILKLDIIRSLEEIQSFHIINLRVVDEENADYFSLAEYWLSKGWEEEIKINYPPIFVSFRLNLELNKNKTYQKYFSFRLNDVKEIEEIGEIIKTWWI